MAEPRKQTATAGQPVTLTNDVPATWVVEGSPHRPPVVNQKSATFTFKVPGVRLIRVTPGPDVELDVRPATPPATNNPTPTPAPDVPQAGTRVPSGGDVRAACKGNATVLLERGGTYRLGGPIDARNNLTIAAYGDPQAPRPRVICDKQAVQGREVTKFVVTDVVFDGYGAKAKGLGFLDCDQIRLSRVDVLGFGHMGVTMEGLKGRGRGFSLIECLIADCWPSGDGHCSGVYASFTDDITIAGNVFDRNGYGNGKRPTVFNHNCYLQSTNGPASVHGNVFARGSSHGLQLRSGGTCHNNLFLDNPVGMTCGYVEGAPVYKGGVTANLTGNVFIGGGKIGGQPRGWALDIGNARHVFVGDTLIAHDTERNDPAVKVGRSKSVKNPADELPPRQWKVILLEGYVWDGWPEGPVRVDLKDDEKHVVVRNNFGGPPPVPADLRAVLGDGFLAGARLNPGKAAVAAIERCRKACGL